MKQVLAAVVFLVLIPGISLTQKVSQQVTFIPHWIPQSQFAGYYVALEKGIYNKSGLNVTILPGGPNVSAGDLLGKGKADFASLWLTNAIFLHGKGIKVINLAQVVKRSALMLIAKKRSGIKVPQDMQGKKIGIWGGDFRIQPLAFFEKFKLNINEVSQGNSINLFLQDGIDVTSAMWYNEYHSILNSGYNPEELTTFFFSDYGLNFPEEGIYCLEKTCDEKPETCKKFVLATLEGWIYAFNNPEEALDIITKYMRAGNYPVNRAHERWMLNRMKDLIFPSGKMENFEKLNRKDFDLVTSTLMEEGIINRIPDFSYFSRPL